MDNLLTPVKADKLQNMLEEANYDPIEIEFLTKGFKEGFSLGYEGNPDVKLKSPNLKIRIGDEIDLWNKVMKEVKLKRYAGPFAEIPFEYYIQSPIGLVPKDNGKDTRLIFHLSYPRTKNSQSASTPKEYCTVKYPDFGDAIQLCIVEGQYCFIAKSDVQSAFRNLSMKKEHWKYLVMKARSPFDGKWYYFFDKNLPFGGSISCSHYQRVSNAVAHLVKYKTGK